MELEALVGLGDGLVSALVTNTDINYRMEGIGIASPNGAVGQQFLYATNQGDTGAAGLYVYSINNGTGALTRIETVATDNNPRALVVSPAGDYLYLTNIGSNTVCSYSINPSTGHPTKIGSYWTGTNPYKLAISPDGKNLYVPNFGGVSYSSYSIASGALTTIQDKAASGANPTSFAVHPSGSFVYGACAASGATSSINQYSRNAVTGVLTPIGAGYVLCDAYCNQVAVAPSGPYLLAACSSGKTIELFSIDQATGALTYQNKWQFSSATSPASVFIAKLP